MARGKGTATSSPPHLESTSMSESSTSTLDTAYRLIDSVTRIKGVSGAVLRELDGGALAEDFLSQEDADRCAEVSEELTDALLKGTTQMGLGALENCQIQSAGMTVRLHRKDQLWLLVFADDSVNLGMLNVELRAHLEMMQVISGGQAVSERDSKREEIFDLLRAEGSLQSMTDECSDDIVALRAMQSMLFQTALDVGVTRPDLTHSLNDINYRIYRDSLLDIGFDFFNRKTLDNYDPALARQVLLAQIAGIAALLTTKLA
jgi:predicted regulator of Ras-like GTPase activity (Roadblock/LC7/MglB family)